MKILFINNFLGPDYLNDCVFHGLNNISDVSIDCTATPHYMLSNYPLKHKLYGKGFTVFCTLSIIPSVLTQELVLEKIRSKFYDKIIYGSIHRDSSYIDEICKIYTKDKIIFLDGEDHTNIIFDLVDKGRYFKRELIENNIDIFPISFAIPEEKIIKKYPNKEKLFGTVVPGDLKTYKFNSEDEYYCDYAKSYYGITYRKGGWDCMRHYEILGAYTIPCFHKLEDCPKNIMVNFPKKLILETNKYSLQNKIHPNYKDCNEELYDYTINNLTTKILAKSIIE